MGSSIIKIRIKRMGPMSPSWKARDALPAFVDRTKSKY